MQERMELPAADRGAPEESARQDALQEQVSKDRLTGLLNRSAAEQYIRQRLEVMTPAESCAMFIVDLDDFKRVNDALGRQAGDRAIRQAAQVLSGLFRASDIVGRLGGDEFIIFLSGKVSERMVQEKAAAVCKNLQLVLGGPADVQLTASVGIYVAAGGSDGFDGMYRCADLALYRAKKGGKHGFCVKHSGSLPVTGDEFRPVGAIPLTGLLEYMDSGVILLEMCDPLQMLYVSPSFCRILGVDSKAYAMPKRLDELVHPDDLQGLEKALRGDPVSGRPVEYTLRVSKDGQRWAWWQLRAVTIEYDDPYPVMMVTTTDISRYKENEIRLEEINERLQIAFDQTTQSLWEVDLPRRSFRLFVRGGREDEGEALDFPDKLIERGWVHPNSLPRFKEFAASLLEGQVQGYGSFILQDLDTGCYGWTALSYRMTFDEVGRASRAVGIAENLPQSFMGEETRSVLSRPVPTVLMADLMVGLRANLTQDSIQTLWVEGRNEIASARGKSCTQMLQRAKGKLFLTEMQERYASYFDREALLEWFSQGEHWLALEYQRVDQNGRIVWVSHTANLMEDPLTHDVYLFLYIAGIDWRHNLETAAKCVIRRDPVSRLYREDSVRAMAESFLLKRKNGSCAVAVLRVGGLSRLFEKDPDGAERGRRYLATAFSLALGSRCLLAQCPDDQILVFFPQVSSQRQLRDQMEEAFTFVRLVLAGVVPTNGLRFVAGVVTEPPGEVNYSAMTAQAFSLCQLLRSAAEDTVVFPHEGDDWVGMRPEAGSTDQVTVHQTEMERPLSQGEKDVAFRCVSAMLSADTLEASLKSVLSYIGSYYHADRVYILTLIENRHAVSMPYEWMAPQKRSIQQAVSGALVDHVPLLRRCMEEHAPVFLTRTQPISLQGERPGGETWYYTVFPLIEKESVRGFLCIENAREHPADAALFSTLIPYILRERERFQKQGTQPTEMPAGSLLDLPNLRSYMEVIYTISSEQYSSMGAVCLDIPSLSAINSSLGFEYGSKLLWYVSKTLADHFGPGWIFRTWDAEFVALCPNTTQQVFEGRYTRLRSVLQRRYPKELRFGYAWADGRFQAKDLVSKARAMMHNERAAPMDSSEDLMLYWGRYRSVREAARSGCFTVFFQPQVDMRSGALIGAEALVRGIDEDGSIIPPGRFVSALEKNGSIWELDLFVLERAFSQLDRWRRQGLGELRVSVNLSRVSLLNPSALASVLAIQSRYPDVPSADLELEITESYDTEGNSELQAVMDSFRACGLQFSLDDFGSKYANLSIFANVKFDTVKLDRSLITGLVNNAVNQMLIRDIVQICRACGTLCIAEGIEEAEQAKALQSLGCNYAQGYYYDRPLPAEQFEEKYLRAGPARVGKA